jgi:hypothetical protein
MPSLPETRDTDHHHHHHHRAGVAAELLPLPFPGAPTCACCTPDPARRAALERLRAQRDRLVIARWVQREILSRCCGPRGQAA